MVANTIINRVESVRYPDKVCDVVMQKNQFSFYWDGKTEGVYEKEAWTVAIKLAEWSLEHHPSYYEGCHYHADYVRPNWAMAFKPVIYEGVHVFYSGGC
jgi:spore germination cell wall hydrolase CwlJ-like protein